MKKHIGWIIYFALAAVLIAILSVYIVQRVRVLFAEPYDGPL